MSMDRKPPRVADGMLAARGSVCRALFMRKCTFYSYLDKQTSVI